MNRSFRRRRALSGLTECVKETISIFLCFVLCAPMLAQQNNKAPATRDGNLRGPQPDLSEFEMENLSRVAASSAQIQEVLRGNAGLMVELKQWVAREATLNGQIVEEGDLSDRAISDRLSGEVRFRAMATRLLQRYGYLLPKAVPGSQSAREQESILAAQRPSGCDSQSDPSCQEQPEGRTRRGGLPAAQRPNGCDPQSDPSCQVQPEAGTRRGGLPLSRTLQTNSFAGDSESHETLGLELAASKSRKTAEAAADAAGSAPTGTDDAGSIEAAGRGAASRSVPGNMVSPRSEGFAGVAEGELHPVAMVRRPSPYADIPSLYDMYVQAASQQKAPERFGMELFRNGNPDPNTIPMDLPVGPDYVVGPGDGLAIDLWGGVSQRLLRTVDREGRLSLPEAGPLLVSGRSLGEVQDAVQRVLRTQYRGVSADISLARLRTIRVYVVGDIAEPGAYDISSLSTPLNALFAAGGVAGRGSLRMLKHYRGKQLVQEVDAYDLLLHGLRSDLKRLENGDTLLILPLGPQVTVEGMVRRPAIYEVRGEKTLADILDLAGGILPTAALSHVEVQRVEAHEKRTMLSLQVSATSDDGEVKKQLTSFEIAAGDEIHIFPIAPFNVDAVYLQGHVQRPGRYAFRAGMRLSDLIVSYNDMLPEPAGSYAEIVRLNPPDYRPSVESFNLTAALEHPESAPKLKPLDTVRIFSRYDFESAPAVSVGGEVRTPGTYRTSGQAHLRDAIYLAGGVTPDAKLENAQLFRAIPDGTMKILSINLNEALSGNPVDNLLLQPRDHILIHRNLNRVDPPKVTIRGEVAKPGRYPLAESMRLSDLIRSAGGFKRSAATATADLTRYSISESGKPGGDRYPINLSAIMAGNGGQDLALQDGDVLSIPQIPGWNDIGAVIEVRGEVKNPGVYGIRTGEHLSSVLERAGGFLPSAFPPAAVVERSEVRQLQEKARQELIQRLEQENATAKPSTTASVSEQAALQQAAFQQRERALEGVRKAPVTGRLVVNLTKDLPAFAKSPSDIEVRMGDVVEIPKRPGFVLVTGQVYNSNAITFQPRKNAAWYLRRAGGPTNMADKSGIFIIRASGVVESGKSSVWSKGVLSRLIAPGDIVVVPEKAIGGGSFWKNLLSIAQLAQTASLTALIAAP
jgi:protein involved in polysaccharide export with SLBB domain